MPGLTQSLDHPSHATRTPVARVEASREAEAGIRTRDPLFTRQVLWPSELLRRVGLVDDLNGDARVLLNLGGRVGAECPAQE